MDDFDDEDDLLRDEEADKIIANLSKKKIIVLEDEVDEFDKEYEDELEEMTEGFKIFK